MSAARRENLEGHRLGIAAAREKRRERVLDKTTRLMAQMDAAGVIANENILLHSRAARDVIDSLNSMAAVIDDFHTPLRIESTRHKLSATTWREAIRDSQQRRKAGREVGQKAAVGALAVGAFGAATFAVRAKDDSEANE